MEKEDKEVLEAVAEHPEQAPYLQPTTMEPRAAYEPINMVAAFTGGLASLARLCYEHQNRWGQMPTSLYIPTDPECHEQAFPKGSKITVAGCWLTVKNTEQNYVFVQHEITTPVVTELADVM